MSEIVEFEGKKLKIIEEGSWPEGVELWSADERGEWRSRMGVAFLREGRAQYTNGTIGNHWKHWAIEVQEEKAQDVLHDSHYKKIASEFIENIVLQEYMMLKDIPKNLHDIVLRNFNLATAMKYPLRMGEKDDWKKELMKMENYTHRARTKGWIK
jgi:hypothetical protein